MASNQPTQQEVQQPETSSTERREDEQSHDEEEEEDEHDLSAHHEHHPAQNPITPAVHKRRQATKHIMIQSPTDNIFSPISQKLLGKKRNDAARELPEF